MNEELSKAIQKKIHDYPVKWNDTSCQLTESGKSVKWRCDKYSMKLVNYEDINPFTKFNNSDSKPNCGKLTLDEKNEPVTDVDIILDVCIFDDFQWFKAYRHDSAQFKIISAVVGFGAFLMSTMV